MNNVLNADAFLTEIKKLNFSGKEFLEILGNSKISNSVYNEIKESKGLTYGRLVELLESSPLTSDDYTRLLGDAVAVVRHREQNNQKTRQSSESKLTQALEASQKRLEERERALRAAQLLAEAKKKIREEQLIKESREVRLTREILQEPEPEPEPVTVTEIPAAVPESTGAFEVNIDFSREEETDEEAEAETEEIIKVSASDNKGKLILCLIMSVVLICASFTVRYIQTGSLWVEREKQEILTVPETYTELSQRLMNAEGLQSLAASPAGSYRLTDIIEEELPRTFLNTDRYIFNIINNKFYVVEVRGGSMTATAEIEYNGEIIREMYLRGGRLYVISEGEYRGSYYHLEETEDDDPDALPPEPVTGDFTQKTVTVRAYDTRDFSVRPALELTLGGEYNKILFQGGRVIIAADYTPHEPAAHSDLNAFVPVFAVNGNERQFIDIDNIYAPPARLMNTEITVLGIIGNDEAAVYAAVGGKADVSAGENMLLIIQNAESKSRLIKLDPSGVAEPVFYDIKGTVPYGAVDERGRVTRIGAYDERNKNSVYILDSQMKLISRVINIGEEKARNVLFDDKHVCFITDKLYVFNTTEPDDIIPVDESFVHIYADMFYKINDREKLEVLVETDGEGQRAGIRLNIHANDEITATYLIIVENNVAGNWNPFLFTDAETDREAVFILPERGIILIPVKYFNSISNIERLIVFDYNEFAGLVRRNDIVYFDINTERRRAALIDGFIYSFWDTMVVSAREDGTIIEKLEL